MSDWRAWQAAAGRAGLPPVLGGGGAAVRRLGRLRARGAPGAALRWRGSWRRAAQDAGGRGVAAHGLPRGGAQAHPAACHVAGMSVCTNAWPCCHPAAPCCGCMCALNPRGCKVKVCSMEAVLRDYCGLIEAGREPLWVPQRSATWSKRRFSAVAGYCALWRGHRSAGIHACGVCRGHSRRCQRLQRRCPGGGHAARGVLTDALLDLARSSSRDGLCPAHEREAAVHYRIALSVAWTATSCRCLEMHADHHFWRNAEAAACGCARS